MAGSGRTASDDRGGGRRYAGAAGTTGTQAALFTAFAPASAVAFPVLLLGEPLAAAHPAGLCRVLAGVLLGAGSARP